MLEEIKDQLRAKIDYDDKEQTLAFEYLIDVIYLTLADLEKPEEKEVGN